MKWLKRVLVITLVVALLLPSVGIAATYLPEEDKPFLSEDMDLHSLLKALNKNNPYGENLEVLDIRVADDKTIEILVEDIEEPIVVELDDVMTQGLKEAINNGNAKLDVEQGITRYGLASSQQLIRLSFEGRYSEYDLIIPLNMRNVVEISAGRAENDVRIFRIEVLYNGVFMNIDINIPINVDKVSDEIKDRNIAAAKRVEEIIAKLPIQGITLEDKPVIEAARAEYDGLRRRQKALVDNLHILKLAESKISELEYEVLYATKEKLESHRKG